MIANEGGGNLLLGIADKPPRPVVVTRAVNDPIGYVPVRREGPRDVKSLLIRLTQTFFIYDALRHEMSWAHCAQIPGLIGNGQGGQP